MTDFLTAEQAGEQIGMSADYVRRQCSAGRIRAKKLGTGWRIHRRALEEFMTAPGAAPATRQRLSARQMRRAS